MRAKSIMLAGLFALSGCGGGSATLSSKPLPAAPAAVNATVSTVALELGANPNGAMIAAISSAVFVGSQSAPPGTAPITLTVSGRSATSVARSPLTLSPSTPPRAALLRSGQAVREERVVEGHNHPTDAELAGNLLASLHAAPSAEGTIRKSQGLPSTAGAHTNLWVQYFHSGVGGVSFSQVPATLALQTTRANIWVADGLPLASDAATLAKIGANIELAMASDDAHFGTPTWDANAPSLSKRYTTCDQNGVSGGGNSPLWIVPADARVNYLYVNPSAIGVGGYMDVLSLSPESVVRCVAATNGRYHSNEAPLIVLSYYGDARGLDYVLREDSIVHPAHEYQHLINAVHHGILQPDVAYEDPLINEGLSMLAQDLALSAATGGAYPLDGENVFRSSTYLAAPQNYSVAGFAGAQSGGAPPLFNCATCYAPAWLLQRYLYDRFGGDAYSRAMERGGATSWNEVASITGSGAQTLLHDFSVALAASNTSAGGDPRYRFGTLNLRGSYADQFGATTTLTGPAALDVVGDGTSKTYSVLIGAYAYFSAGAGKGNVSVSLTDGSNGSFGLAGALVAY